MDMSKYQCDFNLKKEGELERLFEYIKKQNKYDKVQVNKGVIKSVPMVIDDTIMYNKVICDEIVLMKL